MKCQWYGCEGTYPNLINYVQTQGFIGRDYLQTRRPISPHSLLKLINEWVLRFLTAHAPLQESRGSRGRGSYHLDHAHLVQSRKSDLSSQPYLSA